MEVIHYETKDEHSVRQAIQSGIEEGAEGTVLPESPSQGAVQGIERGDDGQQSSAELDVATSKEGADADLKEKAYNSNGVGVGSEASKQTSHGVQDTLCLGADPVSKGDASDPPATILILQVARGVVFHNVSFARRFGLSSYAQDDVQW